MASIGTQSKEQQDTNRKTLAKLLKMPENQECFDCTGRNPTWASINLGVFLCIRCAGLHRQLGVHITKVRSATMDLWQPDQIVQVQRMGNAKGKFYYEATLPKDYGKPAESEDSDIVMQWLRVKYEQKKYWGTPKEAAAAAAAAAAQGGGVLDPTGAENKTKDKKRPAKRRKSGGPALSPRGTLKARGDDAASPVEGGASPAFAMLSGASASPPAFLQQPDEAPEQPKPAVKKAPPQAREHNVCSVFAMPAAEAPAAPAPVANRAVRGARKGSPQPVPVTKVEDSESSEESEESEEMESPQAAANAAKVTPGAMPLQRGESFLKYMQAAQAQQAFGAAVPAPAAPGPTAEQLLEQQKALAAMAAMTAAAVPAPAPGPTAEQLLEQQKALAAMAAATAVAVPASAPLMTFDSPEKPAPAANDFLATLGAGAPAAPAQTNSILSAFDEPAAPAPQPTLAAGGGQSANEIEQKIRELQAMQEQLTAQIAAGSSGTASPVVPVPAKPAAAFDPFADLPAVGARPTGAPGSGNNSPPPLGGPPALGGMPMGTMGTLGGPPMGMGMGMGMPMGGPPMGGMPPPSGGHFDPFASMGAGGPPPLSSAPTPIAPRPGIMDQPLRQAKPSADPFANLLS